MLNTGEIFTFVVFLMIEDFSSQFQRFTAFKTSRHGIFAGLWSDVVSTDAIYTISMLDPLAGNPNAEVSNVDVNLCFAENPRILENET